MKTMQNLFFDELADIYDAENRLTRAVPKLVKAAACGELKDSLQSHLSEADRQREKLVAVFEAFDQRPRGRKCAAMVGLLKEAEELAADHKGQPTIDAALIVAVQKVKHYEMATYGALRDWADQLGNRAAADLLQEILDEEKAADGALTELARNRCNQDAHATTTPEAGASHSSHAARSTRSAGPSRSTRPAAGRNARPQHRNSGADRSRVRSH